MHPGRIAVMLITSAFLRTAVCCAQDDVAAVRSSAIEPLTRGRAAQILANTDAIADDLTRQIKSLRNPAEAAVIDDIGDVLAHSSEWQWFSRDRGILLAIPVKERLGLLSSYEGEKVLADIVRRLISQKSWGNPPVQVVLIEPRLPAPVGGGFAGQSACRCGGVAW
jgi:hypothetical protein